MWYLKYSISMFLGDKYPQTQAYIRDEASEDDAVS